MLRWRPRGPVHAHAVFFPPFGDEMNQSRRMFRLAAEALAQGGVASCVFDLLGTGDSSADFGEATVSAWLSDCREILRRLDATDGKPVVLIGSRLGVALAAAASTLLPAPVALLIGWAPLLQGRQQLNGLLRAAKIARASRPDVPDPKLLWTAGKHAWLAGYPISSILAEELQSLDATAAPNVECATLFEVRGLSDERGRVASEAMNRRAAAWTEQGVPTEAVALQAPAFWNVADLVDAPELIEATVVAVEAVRAVERTPEMR